MVKTRLVLQGEAGSGPKLYKGTFDAVTKLAAVAKNFRPMERCASSTDLGDNSPFRAKQLRMRVTVEGRR